MTLSTAFFAAQSNRFHSGVDFLIFRPMRVTVFPAKALGVIIIDMQTIMHKW